MATSNCRWTPGHLPIFVDQLNAFVGTVVRVTIVDNNIKAIVFAAHVDHQGEGITNTNGTRHTTARYAVSVANFHVAFGGAQGENDWVAGGHSVNK